MSDAPAKRCPFCGSDKIGFSKADVGVDCGSVGCEKCQTEGPIGGNEIRAIAAWNRRDPAATMALWQPIEMAPKDGTHILAVIPWLPDAKTLFWAPYANEWRCPSSERGPDPEGWLPTHWMPLPTPPAALALAERG
jgi:Lar family restriction alleviation protein